MILVYALKRDLSGIGMRRFCFFFHLFFFPAILFFLAYFAQYFAQKFPILLTFFQTQKRK